ncbi:MAG: DUF5691 domain-containing protein [Gammaproteobacteria bacterium]
MSTLELTLHDTWAIEASLTLGLGKNSLPETAEKSLPPLAAIALAAERQIYADCNVRTERSLPEISPPQDRRPLLPDPLRSTLLRIAAHPPANNPVWEGYCHAIAQHLEQSGFRLHPFDCYLLEKYLSVTNPKPGSYEYWYRQCMSPWKTLSVAEEINWENWRRFGKAEQQAFLLQQRANDPEAARLSLEKDFASASATLRQMYVESMAVGLSQTDQTFLESLASDRSGKVQEAAQRLLARFPGSTAALQNRDALTNRLEVHLLSRKIGLAKQKGKKASEVLQELSALTEYLAIDDIAVALKLTADDLPRKITQELALPFARSAALSQRYSLALALLEKEDKNVLLAQLSAITNWFEQAPLPDKSSLAEAAASWLAGGDALDKPQPLALYDLLQQALPEKAAGALLISKAFKNTCSQSVAENPYLAGNAQEAIAACALLIPESLHRAYTQKVANIPFRSGLNPTDYLAFIEVLNAHLAFLR